MVGKIKATTCRRVAVRVDGPSVREGSRRVGPIPQRAGGCVRPRESPSAIPAAGSNALTNRYTLCRGAPEIVYLIGHKTLHSRTATRALSENVGLDDHVEWTVQLEAGLVACLTARGHSDAIRANRRVN